MNIPAFNKVLETITPLDPRLRLILQLRNRLPHNIRQQINQSSPRLHLRPIGREGKAVLRDLQQRNTSRPNIRSNRVTLTRDPLRRHVVRRPDESVRVTFRAELSADAKITQLDLAVAAEQDVTRLDVAVDDLLAMQISQTVEDALCDLPKDFLAGPAAELLDFAVDGVEGTAFAELHGDGDGGCGGLDEGAVVEADVFAGAVFVEVEFADDLPLDVWVWVCGDDLGIVSGCIYGVRHGCLP